ncbi:hypothetical protein EDB19DRAFT_1668163 [Suillus lakei]|nr:hypothetical protein EDB19DRAFT_1668163 [Suillus lakei]
MIVSAAVMAGVATASIPFGQACHTQGEYSCSLARSGTFRPSAACLWLREGTVWCGRVAGFNGGNAFIYECAKTGVIAFSADCGCPSCCTVANGGAYCISEKA